MSILKKFLHIKGKDMPDGCKTCDLYQYDGLMGFCFVNDEDEIDSDINFFLTDAPTTMKVEAE